METKEARRISRIVGQRGVSSLAICGSIAIAISIALIASAGSSSGGRDLIIHPVSSDQLTFADSSGDFQTVTTAATVDSSGAFFQDLGTNGRRCETCHKPDDAWTITPGHIRRRFDATEGMDPLFRNNDGSTCAGADTETLEARREAFSLLLSKGLIRVGVTPPAEAEFTIAAVDDPYQCAPSSEVSVYRRPLPASNLSFLTTVMWDGRESPKGRSLQQNLESQARDATLGHAQGTNSPTDQQLQDIVAFETGLYTAQVRDDRAGMLDARDGRGGPFLLSKQEFFPGINDPLGGNPTGLPFDSQIFNLFESWESLDDDPEDPFPFPRPLARPGRGGLLKARLAIARGEKIFNTKQVLIEGVSGLNDVLGQKVIPGFCGTCHDSPNVGHHSLPAPLDLGLTDAERRTSDLPLYTLRNTTTGELRQTSDPGRALITGKWADIGKFKGPILRGVAARAPYFHNGSAATLRDVVDFYDKRFQIGFTDQEKRDLVAFLRAL